MAQNKVRKCKYGHGKIKNAQVMNFSVRGNTEAAVKEYLQKRHRNEEITIREINWTWILQSNRAPIGLERQ